jgi:hypothetical protein
VSPQRILEPHSPHAQESERALQAASERGQVGYVGDPMPATLTDSELARRIPLALSSFYRRKKLGHFRFLELKRQLAGGNTLYSGALVQRWLNGEALPDAPAAVSRFFAGARRNPMEATARRGRPGRPKGRANQAVPVLAHDRSLAR